MKEGFLKDLNENQQQAVLYNDGASLVIAGAGSGKTRVLTSKIAYLLSIGYDSDSILALTFTNKAANEMKTRIGKLVGESNAYRLWMGTFHSIFLRILRVNAPLLGFQNQLTIYDTSDSKSLLRSIVKELGLDDKDYSDGKMMSRISNLKNHLILPSDYEKDIAARRNDDKNKIGLLYRVYQQYVNRCRQAGAMDFDDLLVYTYLLFKEYPDVLQRYVDRFQYILVDEYQDTNYVQREIVLQLGTPSQHVCVVGDDAQSIYSFRGANIDNILSFTTDFKEAKIFKLEQNYRSTQNIVLAANSLIEKNIRQIPKSIYSKKTEGDKIMVTKVYSDIEEAAVVVKYIQKLRSKEHLDYSDFVILYRTNAQSRVFEEQMRKDGIPYKIFGGVSFYQRKEIKDVVAYFRLVVNPNDEEALKRVINYPLRGIGSTTFDKIKAVAIEQQVSLWTVLGDIPHYVPGLNNSKQTVLRKFYDMIDGFAQKSSTMMADALGEDIIRATGLMSVSLSDPIADQERRENIEELVSGMKDFVAMRQEEGEESVLLSNYLSEISLLSDLDADTKEADKDKVSLMTVHAAKGLEFTTVFVVGMEENLFPSYMSVNSPRELEEERRLFYVAITRAEKYCFLSYAESRYHFGKMEFAQPSRFLRDIDPEYLQFPLSKQYAADVDRRASKYRPTFERPSSQQRLPFEKSHNSYPSYSQPSHISAPSIPSGMKKVSPASSYNSNTVDSSVNERLELTVGQLIEHERFGVGEVKKVEGSDENRKATIEFRNLGIKVLLLRFARFKIIG
jgi:DNA helicase-2/ATP-dependent DNA helicase PcrA